MKPSPFITIIIVIVVAWASLFITVLNQAHQTHQLLNNDHTLLSKDTDIINGQTTTINILSGKINDLQKHDDCLFNLATQPNHNSSYITDTQTCTISSPSGTKSIAASSSRSPGQPSTTTPHGSNNTNNSQGSSKPPVRSLLNRLTGGLL